jgi:hypothetical protein
MVQKWLSASASDLTRDVSNQRLWFLLALIGTRFLVMILVTFDTPPWFWFPFTLSGTDSPSITLPHAVFSTGVMLLASPLLWVMVLLAVV